MEFVDDVYGSMPNDWLVSTAEDFAGKVTDGTHDSPKQKTVGRYLVTSKHIKTRNIDFENAYLIAQEDFDKINQRSHVEQWNVIISMIGEYCGFVYLERNAFIDYAVKNVGIFKTFNEVNEKWLFYLLQSPKAKEILDSVRGGTSQPYLSLGALRRFPVLHPQSIQEQKTIVSVLSSLDYKIDLLQRQNRTIEATAETLFRQWFVADETEANRTVALGEVVETSSGGTPSRSKMEYYKNGTIRWVKSKELSGSFVVDTEESITEDALRSSAAKLLPANSILIALYGATVGEYALLAEPMSCNQAVCAVSRCAAFRR